ncbi:3'-5' exonuclease [Oceanobacillus polygoni]|uniref:DNA polymerase-3 subunit epsilon n=1 Tax=Oceanobacillus polygoni TaxID=1235259 RepID=A0A9X0YSZ5_9BACI|nr:3'-5' exonuclease [Oceanobacillus polygoni]MBP2076760.1 DNA polymerase-3 subunit epsilon [Oceanobacillus polygoni]
MNFVAIDFETANEKRFSPCSVGLVIANEHGIVDEFYSLINPLMEFKSFNTYIHGITEHDVADAPTFAELWPTLRNYLSHQLAIAHNASFDMSVIRNTLDYYMLPYPEMDYLCTVNISKKLWPRLDNHKLNTLATYHNLQFEHHHALEDAKVAAGVMIQALRETKTSSLDHFLEKCSMTKGKIYDHGYYPPKMKPVKRSTSLFFK